MSTGPDPILTWDYDLSNAALDSMYDAQNNDSSWDYGSNYLPPTDCLQNIGTGFELWNDGSGLESDGTSIDLSTATASPSPSPSATASSTPTASPTDSSSPEPTDSSTPDPTDSSTPSPSPTGS